MFGYFFSNRPGLPAGKQWSDFMFLRPFRIRTPKIVPVNHLRSCLKGLLPISNPKTPAGSGFKEWKKISDSAGIQTWNLLIRSQVLYSVKLRSQKISLLKDGAGRKSLPGFAVRNPFRIRKPVAIFPLPASPKDRGGQN